MIYYLIVGSAAFAVGIFVARLGVWWRIAKIENSLRTVYNALEDERIMAQTSTIPIDWVQNELMFIMQRQLQY